MSSGIIFATLGAIAFGLWTVFHDKASTLINAVYGAIIVSFTAVIIGLIFLMPQLKVATSTANPKGILFAVLAGLCAFGIDYFALKTYGSGLPVTIGAPIIIGGSIAVASIIGFFLGESITFPKVIGLVLVIVGSVILSVPTK